MSNYSSMPQNIDWGLLITLLRGTYKHGDGGLPAESGIDPGVLADGVKNGVHSLDNGIKLWNLAILRLADMEIHRCVVRTQPCIFAQEVKRVSGKHSARLRHVS